MVGDLNVQIETGVRLVGALAHRGLYMPAPRSSGSFHTVRRKQNINVS